MKTPRLPHRILLAVLALLALSLPSCSRRGGGSAAEPQAGNGRAAARKAVVAFVEGEATVGGKKAEPGLELEGRFVASTGPGARLDLVFGERNVLSVGQNALVEVDLAGVAVELGLERGGVTSVLKKLERLAESDSFRIVTAQSIAGVRGTSFCVWADSASTYVCACNGAVRTIDAKGSNELELEAAHHQARLYVAKDGAISVEAAGMLHHTDESVESVASRIGYAIDWTKVDR